MKANGTTFELNYFILSQILISEWTLSLSDNSQIQMPLRVGKVLDRIDKHFASRPPSRPKNKNKNKTCFYNIIFEHSDREIYKFQNLKGNFEHFKTSI